MADNRQEFERLYDDKLKNLQKRLDQERINNSGKLIHFSCFSTIISPIEM